MNWDEIEGNWRQLKGLVRERWGKLTDDDLEVISGRREQLLGKLQERYGMARAIAERELEELRAACAKFDRERASQPPLTRRKEQDKC